MKEDTRWMVIAGIGLITLSLLMYTAHYLIFQDSHHMFIFFMGDLAFIPIEVFIVTIVVKPKEGPGLTLRRLVPATVMTGENNLPAA